MSNRVIFYLIIIVLISVAALLFLNISGIQTGRLEKKFLNPDNVKAVEVFVNDKPHPMNLIQQAEFVNLINLAVQTGDQDKLQAKKIPFDYDKIVVHQIEGPQVVIRPYGLINTQLLMSIPEWDSKGLIRETGPGKLNTLFTEAASEKE